MKHTLTGAYNVDSVLAVMVKGLEEELRERLAGGRTLVANEKRPLAQYEISTTKTTARGDAELPMTQGGGNMGDVLRKANQAIKFVRRKSRRTKK